MAGLIRSTSRQTASFRTTCMNACALPALKFCIIWARKSVLHCNLHRLIAFLSNCIREYRYQHPFRLPAGTWQTLRLSWPGFIRTRRGKELATQHQLDPSNIIRLLRSRNSLSYFAPSDTAVSYGISVVDREEGPFEVQLQWLQGYRLRRTIDAAAPALPPASRSPPNDSDHPVK
jgi:hypothetical protein